MTYHISGASRVTGKDVRITVEAAGEHDARLIAQSRGVMISGIIAEENDAVHFPAARPSAPEYAGLRVVASLMFVCAVVLYIISALALVLGMALAITENRDAAATSLAICLGALFSGLIYHAIAGACQALRDIARNSFHG